MRGSTSPFRAFPASHSSTRLCAYSSVFQWTFITHWRDPAQPIDPRAPLSRRICAGDVWCLSGAGLSGALLLTPRLNVNGSIQGLMHRRQSREYTDARRHQRRDKLRLRIKLLTVSEQVCERCGCGRKDGCGGIVPVRPRASIYYRRLGRGRRRERG